MTGRIDKNEIIELTIIAHIYNGVSPMRLYVSRLGNKVLEVAWMRFDGNLSTDRPLIPIMILLLVVGSRFFCFAFIGSQNNYFRNEMYRLQNQVKRIIDGRE